jgi:predicted MFS family arabinose efflux permease
MHWQPLFSQWLEEKSLGYIWSGISLSIMIGAWIAPKVLARIRNERKVLLGCQVMIGVVIVIASMTNSLVTTLLMFFLHEMFRGAFRPLHSAYLHDNISPKHRATTESFSCMAYHFGGMFGLLFSGLIAQQLGIASGWMISGFVLILSTLFIIKTGK